MVVDSVIITLIKKKESHLKIGQHKSLSRFALFFLYASFLSRCYGASLRCSVNLSLRKEQSAPATGRSEPHFWWRSLNTHAEWKINNGEVLQLRKFLFLKRKTMVLFGLTFLICPTNSYASTVSWSLHMGILIFISQRYFCAVVAGHYTIV